MFQNKKKIAKVIFLFLIFIAVFIFEVKAQKKFFERGLCETIENPSNNKKMMGIHRTLAIGTQVLVKNAANGRTVIVKIVGKLPDTGANNKVIIKISQSAYQALNAKGKQFGVEIMPAPLKDENKEDEEKKEEEVEKLETKDGIILHKVVKGESLYKIAKKYRVSIEELIQWNELKDYDLKVGQKLKIKQNDK